MDNKVVEEYRAFKDDYAYDPSIFNPEPERIRRVKEIISTRLSVSDRTLILLYAEYRSYRKLGQRLRMSPMTVYREILRIRNIILNEYDGRTNRND